MDCFNRCGIYNASFIKRRPGLKVENQLWLLSRRPQQSGNLEVDSKLGAQVLAISYLCTKVASWLVSFFLYDQRARDK